MDGPIANDSENSRGGSWGDYDNDGDLDLFVANGPGNNSLYENKGDGTFTRVDSGPIVTEGGESRGSSWGDYDNDADLDLFVANFGQNNHLYRNDGDPGETGQVSFTQITSGEIVNDGRDSEGCSWADYDNDGDIDLYVANWDDNNSLYENNGNNNKWINIKCVGTFSNASAIGVKVRVKASIGGRPVWQMREISAQTGRYSQNSLNAEFGLGDAALIDSIRIEWTSGKNQILTNIDVDTFMTIIEPVPLVAQEAPVAEANTEIVLAVTDTSGDISELHVKYRGGGESSYMTIPMSNQGSGLFQGVIPAEHVTSLGVEYQILATDAGGRTARLPVTGNYSVPVHIVGISKGVAQPYGSEQTAYRIFSVPLDLDDKSPAALLEDDLGEYDDTRWRFSEVRADESYLDFPDITEILPGKGYWFIVSEPARVIDTGAGTSVITSEEFSIILHSGWNLIGNPFYFPIPMENLRLKDDNPIVLRTFDGTPTASWNDPVFDQTTEIIPFGGYAVFSDAASPQTLFIDPDIPAATNSLLEKTVSMNNNNILWSIQILASCQQARDVDNIAGVVVSAAETWDSHDLPEPPPIGEYVSVYFPHQEWDRLSKRFCTDLRPQFSPGASWEFEVSSNIRDKVELSFAGVEQVPPEFEVWLVDETLGLIQNLREQNQFTMAGPGEDQPKRLKLLVGQNSFISEKFSGIQTLPTDFELSQNFPNPFNPVTTIRYGLPVESTVDIKVYNLSGKEVATLVNSESVNAGYHIKIWNGRTASGMKAASGVYFIRMQAGEFVQTRKMLLIQ